MTRLAILAPRSYQKEVIEALHEARIAHIEEYTTDPEEETLDIGDPLPEGSNASHLLVRIRGILHTLDIGDQEPTRRYSQQEVRNRITSELDTIEEDLEEVQGRITEAKRVRDEQRARVEQLEPFSDLPLNLDDYHGYESLEVFVGEAPENLEPELSREISRFEYFHSEQGHAVFVADDEAQKAEEILTGSGFSFVEPPDGEGSVDDALANAKRSLEEAKRRLEQAEAAKLNLAREHKDLLVCAEEDLSITVEKAEAPLDFASTERTFIVDAWVPTDEVDRVRSLVDKAGKGRVHIEKLDEGDREGHREKEPPTRYEHGSSIQPFSFLTDTFGTPRYGEVDPTVILALVFPLFLGFIIGDLGYGILMVGLGLLLYRRFKSESEAIGSLGFALIFAGFWAALFGGVVFRDFLGIPFYAGASAPSWETLGVIEGLGDPIISKLTDDAAGAPYWGVPEMLALSVLAAFVHLFIGFSFAFANHLGHDKKHAIAQIGWMVVLVGFLFLIAAEGPTNTVSAWLLSLAGDPASSTALIVVGVGLGVLLVTEGVFGLMESVSLLAHVISYTRLAAVAVAKAGILIAFTDILIVDMAMAEGTGVVMGAILFVVGLVFFTIIQVLMFTLGLLSGGIQSIRLNYVEFFLKFFEGGGERFRPFGRTRRFTTETDETTEVQS